MGKRGARSFLKAEIAPTKCDEEHSKNYFVTLKLSMVASSLPSSTSLFSRTSTLDSLCNLYSYCINFLTQLKHKIIRVRI